MGSIKRYFSVEMTPIVLEPIDMYWLIKLTFRWDSFLKGGGTKLKAISLKKYCKSGQRHSMKLFWDKWLAKTSRTPFKFCPPSH